ncbi:MAG TPA: ComEC/Rec2 family competence protein, partial [Chitinispirillaceae bacterium]|nr:ComEC/Rec2 family competence protein [Chitinispirillaceae bacterium]
AFLSWLAVSAGIWVAYSLEIPRSFSFISYDIFYIGSRTFATISLFCGVLIRKKAIRLLSFFFLAIITCAIKEQSNLRLAEFLSELNKNESSYETTAVCASFPLKKNNHYIFQIKKPFVPGDKSGIFKSKTILCKSKTAPSLNHVMKINGKIQIPQKQINPYAFDEAAYLMASNISAVLHAETLFVDTKRESFISDISITFRKKVITFLNHFSKPDHKAVLKSAFLGDKHDLTPQIKSAFRKCGIYHLLAISGLHAGMFITAAYAFLSIFPLSKRFKLLLSILFLWLYLFFIGLIPSLFRATIMASLIILSFLFQKKNYPLHSLGLAGTAWLLFSPKSLFLPGYQLSFFATFSILTITPVFERFYIRVPSPGFNFLITKIQTGLYISISGFLGTAPALLYHFGTISISGIFANIVAVAVMTVCMWAFFISLILYFVFPIFPASYILPQIVCSYALDFLIILTKISSRLKWGELSFCAPFPELIIIYTVFLCLLVTASKEHFVKILKWSVPIFLSFCAIIFLVKKSDTDVKIVRFYNKNVSLSAICWPHNGIWLTYQGDYKRLGNTCKYLLTPWMHYNSGTFIEKFFLIARETDKNRLTDFDTKWIYHLSENDTLSYIYHTNTKRKGYTIDIYWDSGGYIFEVKGQSTRASFNTADTLISFGNFQNFKTVSVPAQINIGLQTVHNKKFN